jgi:hypothetical protein
MNNQPSPLSTETAEDLIPFIGGHEITFRYSDEKCIKITGKDCDDVVTSIDLEHKDGLLTDIEVECMKVKLPNGLHLKSNVHKPGIGHFRYFYDSSHLASIDGAVTLGMDDQDYEFALHREYLYDLSGNRIQVSQNGEVIRTYAYQDDLLVQENCICTELEYKYNENRLVSDLILKEDCKIVNWRKFEYAGNRVVREFLILPGGEWHLQSLHSYDWKFNDVTVHDNVARYFFNSKGKLCLKLKINDDVIKDRGFTLSKSLATFKNSVNMDVRNIDLFLCDHQQKTGIVYHKENGKSLVSQLLAYNKNGLLKTIETAPSSLFHGMCLLSLKPIKWEDICY